MSITFKYTNITECGYVGSDEYEYYGDDFEYEVEDNEIIEALAYLIYQDHFKGGKEMSEYHTFYSQAKDGLKSFLKEHDYLFDGLVEYYEEALKDYFEEDAKYYNK